MQMLNWLIAHANRFHTPEEWATLLEIRIIDNDGFRGEGEWNSHYWLSEFLERVQRATIAPLTREQPYAAPPHIAVQHYGRRQAPPDIFGTREAA